MAANLTTTRHGDVIAMTGVHDRVFDHRLGGVRFVERGSVDEVGTSPRDSAARCSAASIVMRNRAELPGAAATEDLFGLAG